MAGRRIGIVGGVGPSATLLYYQGLVDGYHRLRRDLHFPEMWIRSLDFGEVTEMFQQGRLDRLADKLVGVVKLMEGAGCELGLFACNSMHLVFDEVQARVDLPLVNLIEAVMDAIRERGWSSVGLMGTVFAMRSGLYTGPLAGAGVECLLPPQEDQDWMMNAILTDLQRPRVPSETTDRLVRIAGELKDRGGQGLILGCTDLPVAITDINSPLPVLDSTRIHVARVLEEALAGPSGRAMTTGDDQ